MTPIGKHVSCTVWSVDYTFKQGGQDMSGSRLIITADPTGADLYQVAYEVIVGDDPGRTRFSLQVVRRAAESAGTASLTGPQQQN